MGAKRRSRKLCTVCFSCQLFRSFVYIAILQELERSVRRLTSMNSPKSAALSKLSSVFNVGTSFTGLVASMSFLPLFFPRLFFFLMGAGVDFAIRGVERISRKRSKFDSSVGPILNCLKICDRVWSEASLQSARRKLKM